MRATWASSPRGAARRVLLVEDDYLIAEDLAHDLEREGVLVDGPVATCQGALALLVSPHQPDAAILDVQLADGLVYPLADELMRRGIPFIFATGFDASEVPPRFAHVACWQKPFDRAAYASVLFEWAVAELVERSIKGLRERAGRGADPDLSDLIRQVLEAQARMARLGHADTSRVLQAIARRLALHAREPGGASDVARPSAAAVAVTL